MDFKTLKDRLQKMDAACLFDANKNMRVMDPGIRPINRGLKMIGIAHTVHTERDFLPILKALHDAQEDEVIVIDAEGDKIAVVGELFSMEARRKKLAGIVIDGGCRDVNHIQQLRFPVFARHITPKVGTSSKIFNIQIKVTCGGVSVSPGDIIFGDDDGILVMSEKEITDVLDIAENIQQTEEKVIQKMEAGTSLIELLNYFEHYQKISNEQESKLIFTV